MITPEERNHHISMRIQQAELAIRRVESCLADDEPELAANRIYYGMFYAMLALAMSQGFESSKHQQTIGWFNKNFVHAGIFPNSILRFCQKSVQISNGCRL